jgi:hypothetical protein
LCILDGLQGKCATGNIRDITTHDYKCSSIFKFDAGQFGRRRVHNKTGSREVHMTTTQIENTAACPDKVMTKTARWRVALQKEQPLKMVKGIDRNVWGGTTDTDILMF